jgi:hypothetical protein
VISGTYRTMTFDARTQWPRDSLVLSGKNIVLKWRCGTDTSGTTIGWYVDSVAVIDGFFDCCSGSAPVVSPTISSFVANGTTVELSEVVELAASVRSLYNLATLASRESGQIDQCHALWAETRKQFETLCQACADVPQDGELVSWHRAQLEHLYELAQDRVELYTISEAERREYQERKDTELETALGERSKLTVEETQHYSA